MNRLPDRSNLDHLKKQAKDLIRLYRDGDRDAIARFRRALPAAADRSDDAIVSLKLRLHDAQSCVARDYGFASWADLRSYVAAQSASRGDHEARVRRWLDLVYSGDVDGSVDRATPRIAVRMLAENPGLAAGSPYLACDRRRGCAAAGDQGRPGMGRSPGRAAEPAAAGRHHAFEPAAGAGISRTPAWLRAVAAGGGRRSQPADRQPLAAGFVEQAQRQ